LILDEADEMLSVGFVQNMKDIILRLPKDAQIALFSATMPRDILVISQKFMREPVQILVKKEQLTLDGINQYYVSIGREEWKFPTLINIYKNVQIGQSIIFTSRKERVKELAASLR
jgi:superfamily II DNA/RNA helicase